MGYVYLPGGGGCPIPTKLSKAFFFWRSFLNPPNSGDHGPNGLAEKRGAGFGKKPGGLIFGFFGSPLGVISLWCFSMNLMQIGDIFGIFWLHRFGLQRLILLVVVFLDVFWKEFLPPRLGEMIQLDEYFHENLRVPTQWMTNMVIIHAHRKRGEYFSLNLMLKTPSCRQDNVAESALFGNSYC